MPLFSIISFFNAWNIFQNLFEDNEEGGGGYDFPSHKK
jgi:hypothetical protein